MQEPISRDVAASLVGGELLSALSLFGSPSDGDSVVVAGISRPHVFLAAAVLLAAADSKGPIDALESVLRFASSALACIDGQTVDTVVGAATNGWFVAETEGQPTGAARAFLAWAMVAATQQTEPALDLQDVPGSAEPVPLFSLFGAEVELHVGSDCDCLSEASPAAAPETSPAAAPEASPAAAPEASPAARKGRLVSPIPVVSGPLSGAVSRFGK